MNFKMSDNASGKMSQVPDERSSVKTSSTAVGQGVCEEEKCAVNKLNITTEHDRLTETGTTRLRVLPGNLKGIFSPRRNNNETLFEPWVPDTLANLRSSRVVVVPSKVFFWRPDYISPFFNYDKWVLTYNGVNVMMGIPMMQQSDFGVIDSSGDAWKLTGNTEEEVDNIITRLQSRPSVLHALLSSCDIADEDRSQMSVILFLGPQSRCVTMAIEQLQKAKQRLKIKGNYFIEIDLSDVILQWSAKVLPRKYECMGGKFCISGALSGDWWADDSPSSGCFACLKKNNKVSVGAGITRKCDDIVSVLGSKGVSTLKQKHAYFQLMKWIESVPPPTCGLCDQAMTERGNQECDEIHHIYRNRQQDDDTLQADDLDQIDSSSISHAEISDGLETIYETDNEYESLVSSSSTSSRLPEQDKNKSSVIKQHIEEIDVDEEEEEEEEESEISPEELDGKLADDEKYRKWLRNDQLFYLPEYSFERYFNQGQDDYKRTFLGQYTSSIASTLENSFQSPRSDKLSIKRNAKKSSSKPVVNSLKSKTATTQNSVLPIKAKCLEKEYQIPLQMFTKYAKCEEQNRTKLNILTVNGSPRYEPVISSTRSTNGLKKGLKNVCSSKHTDNKHKVSNDNKCSKESMSRTGKYSTGVNSTVPILHPIISESHMNSSGLNIFERDVDQHFVKAERSVERNLDVDDVNAGVISDASTQDIIQHSTNVDSRVDINLVLDDFTNHKMHQNDDNETNVLHTVQAEDSGMSQCTSELPDVYYDVQVCKPPTFMENKPDSDICNQAMIVPPNSVNSFNKQTIEPAESGKDNNCGENDWFVKESTGESTRNEYSKNIVHASEDSTIVSSGNKYASASVVAGNSLVINHASIPCVNENMSGVSENGLKANICVKHTDALAEFGKDCNSETTTLTTGNAVIPWSVGPNYTRTDNSVHSASPNRKSSDNVQHSTSPVRISSDNSMHSAPPTRKLSNSYVDSESPTRKLSNSYVHSASPTRKLSNSYVHSVSPTRKQSNTYVRSASPTRKLSNSYAHSASPTRKSSVSRSLSPSYTSASKREHDIVSPENILRLSRASVSAHGHLVDKAERASIKAATRENTWVTSQGSSSSSSASPVQDGEDNTGKYFNELPSENCSSTQPLGATSSIARDLSNGQAVQAVGPLVVNDNPSRVVKEDLVRNPVKPQSVHPPKHVEVLQQTTSCAPSRRREAFQEIEVDMSKAMRYSFREGKSTFKEAILTSNSADSVHVETGLTSEVKILPPRPKRPPGFVHPYYEDVTDSVFSTPKRFDVVNFLTFHSDKYSEDF